MVHDYKRHINCAQCYYLMLLTVIDTDYFRHTWAAWVALTVFLLHHNKKLERGSIVSPDSHSTPGPEILLGCLPGIAMLILGSVLM